MLLLYPGELCRLLGASSSLPFWYCFCLMKMHYWPVSKLLCFVMFHYKQVLYFTMNHVWLCFTISQVCYVSLWAMFCCFTISQVLLFLYQPGFVVSLWAMFCCFTMIHVQILLCFTMSQVLFCFTMSYVLFHYEPCFLAHLSLWVRWAIAITCRRRPSYVVNF